MVRAQRGGEGAKLSQAYWFEANSHLPSSFLFFFVHDDHKVVATAYLLASFDFDFEKSGQSTAEPTLLEKLMGKQKGELEFTYDLTLNLEGSVIADVKKRQSFSP